MQLRLDPWEEEREYPLSAECSGLLGALQMAQAGLAAEDEQVAVDACEIFIDLIEAPAPILGPSIPDLVRWCMQVATSTQYELATREMALQARLLSCPVNCVMCTQGHSQDLNVYEAKQSRLHVMCAAHLVCASVASQMRCILHTWLNPIGPCMIHRLVIAERAESSGRSYKLV